MSTALMIVRSTEDFDVLKAALPPEWHAEAVGSADLALERLRAGGVALLVMDVEEAVKPPESALPELKTLAPWAPIVCLLPEAQRPSIPSLLALGATDVLLKPILPAEANARFQGALARFPNQPSTPLTKAEEAVLLGPSPAMAGIREQIAIVAPTEIPVLILGESGTGRGVIARQVHYQSARAKAPFVVVNCQGVPEATLEVETFGQAEETGHGAARGHLEEAEGGTLFFDEVADFSPAFQARLLKIMREREYARIGETTPRSANLRFIFASSRDLAAELAAKRIREDFYYRIQTFPLTVPPLRERTEDIPVLARAFLQSYCREIAKPFEDIEEEALECLLWYPWPGNVRELQARMRFCTLVLSTPTLRRDDLPFELQGHTGRGVGSFAHARVQFEREYLIRLLRKHKGNINRMAKESGKQRVEIYRMLKRYRLSVEKFRGKG